MALRMLSGRGATRRLSARRLFLSLVALSVIVGGPASAAVSRSDSDPLPVGVCVRATAVDGKPVCVMVEDPTR